MAGIPENSPLITSGVIGDVLDPFTPTMNLKVTYNLNQNMQVINGREFHPSIVASDPWVEIEGDGDNSDFFTLVMTDPDAPSPSYTYLREHLHWLLTDIQGTPTIANFATELVRYESPNPIGGSHRYVFALFKQPRENCVSMPRSRDRFNTMKFAEENEFGLPVAALYFKSERQPAPARAVVGSNF